MKKILVVIPVRPVPFTRPRFGKHKQVFETKRYSDFKKIVAWHVKSFMAQNNFSMFDSYCHVKIDFFKKTRSPAAKNWGDLDNFFKSTLDALNGVLWVDDSIILQLQGSKNFSEKNKIVLCAMGV